MSLEDLGWTKALESKLRGLEADAGADVDLALGRVVAGQGQELRVATESGELKSGVAGALSHRAASAAELPAVGDWVLVDEAGARVTEVLPRRNQLSRMSAGRRSYEQVVAANVDTVVIVMGLDGDFNVRRLERFLTMAWESGARPVVILSKADLSDDVEARRLEAEEVSPGVDVHVVSSVDGLGLDVLERELRPGETCVLIGSSGVGKSTLINRLVADAEQRTETVRESDDRGRHTTTHREMFRTPWGALIIDNPGVRELQLWASEASLERTFVEIDELAESCRYGDCSHTNEPGCAVQEALEDGRLPRDRYESFRALQKELEYQERRKDESAQRIQKSKWKSIHKEMRKSGKHRRT